MARRRPPPPVGCCPIYAVRSSPYSIDRLELLVAWHQNKTIAWDAFAVDLAAMKANLRQAVENVVNRQLTDANQVTILVAGKPGANLQAIWQAYHLLAQRNAWTMTSFKLTNYDPLLDPESAESRRRISEKKPVSESVAQPVLQLLAETSEQNTLRGVASAFPPHSHGELDLLSASVIGFALTIDGQGAAGWLSEEYGVIHFFDVSLTGSRRRTRYRVDVASSRLANLVLPKNWPEPSSLPERDPRKLIAVNSQEIIGSHGLTVSDAQGKLADGLLELMMLEHEQALWRAIGYSGIPAERVWAAVEMLGHTQQGDRACPAADPLRLCPARPARKARCPTRAGYPTRRVMNNPGLVLCPALDWG